MFTKIKSIVLTATVLVSTALFAQSDVSIYITGFSMDYSERGRESF